MVGVVGILLLFSTVVGAVDRHKSTNVGEIRGRLLLWRISMVGAFGGALARRDDSS
jgi:hypothetical protein